MKTRTGKALGATAAVAAIAMSLPLAITAYADPPPEPTPVAEMPDPQGPACDPVKQALPTYKSLSSQPVGTALAQIPGLSTFSSAVSGQLNPAVNIVPVLENGPYVVFAPTDEAFAALPPGQLDALKADPAALTSLVYYHTFLGLLGPDDVKGQRPTQQGAEINVTGKGGDIKVNDTAKVLCGAIQANNATDLPHRHGIGPGRRSRAVDRVAHVEHHDHAPRRRRRPRLRTPKPTFGRKVPRTSQPKRRSRRRAVTARGRGR